MKKLSFLFITLAGLLAFVSCSEEPVTNDERPIPEKSGMITQHGKVDGVTYSLKNVVLNPDVIVINAGNAELLSSREDISGGVMKVNTNLSISEGDIVYIHTDEFTTLRKVVSARKSDSGLYELETDRAQLGELFQDGDMSVSLDLYEMSKAMDEKNPASRSAYGIDRSYEILNLTDEYDWGNGFTYNPSTRLNMSLHMSMAFNRSQLLPSRFVTYFEIQPAINPLFAFAGSANHMYSDDVVRFIPAELIEFIKQQEFEVNIPVNILGIETLPAKIKIEDIHIPTTIEANLSKESSLAYSINGSFKIGYAIDVAGLKAVVTPIYENNITAGASAVSDLYGELITNSDIIITPGISVLDDSYKVTGDIVMGLKTETNTHVNLPDKSLAFASKGVFTSRMTLLVDLLLIKVPVDIFNQEQELWNTGAFDKQVVYSDLTWKVSSKYASNLLLLSRMYETDFTVKYKYPILGKRIPNELLISYEVYQDNNSTRILTETDLVIVPYNVTDNSFSFKLNIPYKSKFLSYQQRSYLKNIVIKDRNGYVYEGIYNSAKGINENSFTINR